MNTKKTKTMIVEKTPEKHCEVNVKGQRVTQVKQCKYLWTTVENTRQCKTKANRINQAKIAFWKKATILRSNISMKTRIRILMYYVSSVLSYACVKVGLISKSNRPQNQCFWNECGATEECLRNSWTSHSNNNHIDVLQKFDVKETTTINNLNKQKDVLCGPHDGNTSGHCGTLLTTIGGRLEDKRVRMRPRRTWVEYLETRLARYDRNR